MKKDTNVFILTTEYHFLLAVHIIEQQYPSSEFDNVLIFTGERLSMVKVNALPPNYQVVALDMKTEKHLRKFVYEKILKPSCANIFVFTAYRDLETYVLCLASRSVVKHLVQDGANFYFEIRESVLWGRFKETARIYLNLLRKGILLKRIILYKKHLADCSFIDRVWVTNPEIYIPPKQTKIPVSKIMLNNGDMAMKKCLSYFNHSIAAFTNSVLYLSPRLTSEEQIELEIGQLNILLAIFGARRVVIKLHPYATTKQVGMFESRFGENVLRNFVPAELYIAKAINLYVVGVSSAALYFNNSECMYFSLLKVFQRLGMYPGSVSVIFPSHVRVVDEIEEVAPTGRDII